MKKIILAILILVLPSTALAQPVIKFSEDIYNFGVVNGKSALEHTFEVSNEGTEPLIIKQVSPPCYCTAAIISANVLNPGEKGKIAVTFDPDNYKGPVVKEVWVFSNDPKRPKVTLFIKAEIVNE
jgi:hypothetical protein